MAGELRCDEPILGVVVWAFPFLGSCDGPWCKRCFHDEDAERAQRVADHVSGMFSGAFAPEPKGLPPMRSCDWCGGQVATPRLPPAATPLGGPRLLAFCSPGCWYARQLAKRRVTHEPKVCDVCGETFTPTRADARYHSPACRQRAYRQRTKEAPSRV